jgi:glutamyl-tRNA synthetase
MVNFLALLGWYPGDDIEILSREEMIERFTLEGINRKSAVFDPVKLSWLNGQYLIRMSADALLDEVTPLLVERGWIGSAEIDARRDGLLRMVELLKTRARTIAEIADQAEPYVRSQPAMDPAAVAKHWKNPAETKRRLSALRTLFANAAEWDDVTLEPAVRGLAEAEGVGAGRLIHPLRVAVTGLAASPGIFDVLGLLGRDLTLARIDRALDRLDGMESEANAG